MPCQDSNSEYVRARMAAESENRAYNADLLARLDDATRAACSALACLDGRHITVDDRAHMEAWRDAHRADDADRASGAVSPPPRTAGSASADTP